MKDEGRPVTALGLVAVLWLMIVLVGYYYIHKPILPPQALALGRLGLTLIGWLGTLALAAGVGRALTPFLSDIPARERLALQTGLGLGALGLVMLCLGAIGGYQAWIAWAALLIGLVTLHPPPSTLHFFADLRTSLPRWPASRADRALAIFAGLTLALAFLRALAPPTAWDALVYHLTGPKLYVAAGRLAHDVDNPFLGFPQWPEMLFTWAMLLGSPAGAQLQHFTFAILTLALVPGLMRPHAPGRSWLAGALLLSIPTAALLASWAYVEWFTMFAVAASFYSLQGFQRMGSGKTDGRVAWLALAGVFAGLAFAAKYTAAGAIVGLGVLVVLRAGRRRAMRAALIFGIVAVLVALPWLIKNWALTGNPVYPFVFAGKFWDAYRAQWYSQPGMGLRGWALVVAPWMATVWGVEGGSPYGADIGPEFLGLIPFLFLGWRTRSENSRRALFGALVVVAAAYSVWIGQMAWSRLLVQTRLLLPIFPLLAVLAATAFDNLGVVSMRFAARWVAGGMLALVLTLNLIDQVLAFAAHSPLAVITGAQSEADYLTSQLGMHSYAMGAVNELPAGSRVAFLWEPRTFYCERLCEPDAILDRWWHLRRTAGGGRAIADRWRSEGVTHVLIYQLGAEALRAEGQNPYQPDDWAELETLRMDELTLVVDLGGAYQLYRVAPK